MDSLHTVLRSLRGETKSRRDHLSVFREFLDHLGRIGRSRPGSQTRAPSAPASTRAASLNGKRPHNG